MLNRTAALAITLYQRHLSPLKGYHCAYRCHSGRASCSEFARRLALRHGVLTMLRALPRQFARCRAAYAALAQESPGREGPGRESPGQRKTHGRRQRREPESRCDRCDVVEGCCEIWSCDIWPWG